MWIAGRNHVAGALPARRLRVRPKHYTHFSLGFCDPSGSGREGGVARGCSLVPRSTPANRFELLVAAATTLSGGLEVRPLAPLESPGSSEGDSSLATCG